MSRATCKIILVRPRDPNNIGAVARAMKNFGLNELAVVAPFAPTWDETVAAVNAEDVLQKARVCATLAEAIADCTFVVGTADHTRLTGQHSIYTPHDLAVELSTAHHRVALVFGSEKHGLTKNDLAHCHRVMSIPTSPGCPSMNLGQAVAICCYELTRTPTTTPEQLTKQPPATAGETETGLQLLVEVMREAEFIYPHTEAATTLKLRQRLLQLGLTSRDVHRLCGVLRQIQWRFTQKSAE